MNSPQALPIGSVLDLAARAWTDGRSTGEIAEAVNTATLVSPALTPVNEAWVYNHIEVIKRHARTAYGRRTGREGAAGAPAPDGALGQTQPVRT
jgi:hypothetical protein